MSEPKTLLVLLSGGYSTRLGIPKHTIKTADGNFLFEGIVKNVPVDTMAVITNQTNVFFWNKWFSERSMMFGKHTNVIVEPHREADKAFGPLRYLTSNIPIIFGREFQNILFAPIDSYYENYDFIANLMKQENAFVVSKYPDNLLKEMGVVKLDWRGKPIEFFEKPITLPDTKNCYAFTGMVKTTMANLLALNSREKSNFNVWSIHKMIEKGVTFKSVKCGCFFRDVGIPETYNTLVANKVLLEDKKV